MPGESDTTRLSSKGQVVLPSSLRRAHKWGPGTEFVVQETSDGVLLKPIRQGESRVEDVAGSLRAEGPPRTLAEMQDAIAREVRKRSAGGVSCEDVQSLGTGIEALEHGLDFADAVHFASGRNADAFASFDRRFVRRAKKLWPSAKLIDA